MEMTRWALVLLLATAPSVRAAQESAKPDREGLDFFESRVRPVLVDRCYSCHSRKAEKLKGGLLLDTREGVLKGGISGPAIVPGDPERSLLVRALRRTDENLQMPPKKPLDPEQVADFEAWVKRGAPDPRVSTAALPAPSKTHWAFQPVKDPAPPAVRDASWARNPLDRFVLAKLEDRGLRPAPPADRRTLLRRATFDLHGLPPTPEEVAAFEADPSPDAFERVVERLLASPRYGERWARHWLDVARYADTKGYAFEERRFAYSWGYRDWVIRAMNEDLPYDRFLLLQIAGEQVAQDPRDRAAMGFLTIGRKFLNNVPDIIDDRLDVIFRGTQGLSLGCARCHDHKYDPIPTKDYYSLYGVMASSVEPDELPLPEPLPDTASFRAYEKERRDREEEARRFLETRATELLASLKTPDELARYLRAAWEMRGLHENDVKPEGKRRKLNPAVLARWWWHLREAASGADPILSPWHALAAKAELPAGAHPEFVRAVEERQPSSLDELAPFFAGVLARLPEEEREALFRRVFFDPARWLKNLFYPDGGPVEREPENPAEPLFDEADRKKLGELRKKAKELEFTHAGAPARPMILEDLPEPVRPRVFIRGNKATLGDQVPRRFLEVLAGPDRKPFAQGSGRLELARSIASPANPLTARVMANRVWAWHFGHGIVRTPSDFGVRCEPPSHPELLDWLASRFVEDAWSLKALHRRILLSATWRQASEGDPETAKADPENFLLGRMNSRRLDFESMRDSLLSVSGRLDRSTGGRGGDILTGRRRTVYASINREALPGVFRTFDFALPDTHAPQRHVTTVPQQALFLMNSPFILEQARALAARPDLAGEKDPSGRIHRLHRLLFGRAASPRELELGLGFVSAPAAACGEDCDCGARPAAPGPWERYAQVLLQSNEFAYVD